MQKLTIPQATFTVELTADNERELFRQAAFWQSLPTVCGECGSPLVLDYRTPKTYKYYALKCTGPQPHSINLGQKMDSGELYFDGTKPWVALHFGGHNEQ